MKATRASRRWGRVVVTAALVALAASAWASQAHARDGSPERPNIVVLMTDDQTVESLRVMPKLQRIVLARGVEFLNSFATNPTCCPSRASFLTGQYSHNHGVYRNSSPHGGYVAFEDANTLPVWLQRAGYFTAHIGKYLNGYGTAEPVEIPPGWSEWYGAVDPSAYSMHGYTLNENGTLVAYGDTEVEDPATYQTDVYAEKAADLIARRAPRRKPFFLSLAPLAPHLEVYPPGSLSQLPNPRPAPRHAGAFDAEPLPNPPSFNEADVSDKPSEIRALGSMTSQHVAVTTAWYRSRLASLLAVDDMVRTIAAELRQAGELSRTVILFTSDNGFLQGEHRIRAGKQYPYEESVRVPLAIRGPGIPQGGRRRQPVANIDLAPTILDYAGAGSTASLAHDGGSLRRLIDDPRLEPGRAIVLENWCESIESCFHATTPRYRAVRTRRYLYAEYPNGERELYDVSSDPFQLDSVHAEPYAEERAALAELLHDLEGCAGSACRARPDVRLALTYRQGREDGEFCSQSPVEARVAGPDRPDALTARFSVGGRELERDPERRLALLVPRAALDRHARTEVSAVIGVMDGRLRTVRAMAPPRC